MLTFKRLKELLEMKKPRYEVPAAPASTPVPKDHVRLFHQTAPKNLSPIRKTGIEPRQPIEGPRGIYADEKGFYGKPEHTPSVEFHVHKSEWDGPFVKRDKVEPDKIIATHKPWHSHVRYIENNPEAKAAVLKGEHDDALKKYKGDDVKAIRFIKKKYNGKL